VTVIPITDETVPATTGRPLPVISGIWFSLVEVAFQRPFIILVLVPVLFLSESDLSYIILVVVALPYRPFIILVLVAVLSLSDLSVSALLYIILVVVALPYRPFIIPGPRYVDEAIDDLSSRSSFLLLLVAANAGSVVIATNAPVMAIAPRYFAYVNFILYLD